MTGSNKNVCIYLYMNMLNAYVYIHVICVVATAFINTAIQFYTIIGIVSDICCCRCLSVLLFFTYSTYYPIITGY